MLVDCASTRSSRKETDVLSLEDFYQLRKFGAQKAKEQYQQLLLAIDVHGPAKLRANIQVQNIDSFFTTSVLNREMVCTGPEDRVQIR